MFAALVVRLLSIGGAVLGDESWYLYLSHSFGREAEAAADNAWFHLLNRPLYYAIYHVGTYAGFAGFRTFGCLVGSLQAVAAFFVARALGARRSYAIATACILCIERPLVEYGSHGFPDPLAGVFALAAVWAAARQRPALMCLLAACCVLSKESFVTLPFIAVAVRASGPLRLDRWDWMTVLLPTAYVAAVTTLGTGIQGIALQGWANALMSWKHARGMWVGPELWPLIAWCLWRRRIQWLAIWLGMPAFYTLWSFGLGRGLAPWYVIGPASLGAVAAALAFSDLDQHFQTARARIFRVALMAGLIPIAWSGIFRTGSQVLALRDGWPQVDDGQAVRLLLREMNPESVLLINCFWSYGYSHLRVEARPSRRAYWPSGEDLQTLQDSARSAAFTIVCRSPGASDKEQRLASQGFEALLRDGQYWVLSPVNDATPRSVQHTQTVRSATRSQ